MFVDLPQQLILYTAGAFLLMWNESYELSLVDSSSDGIDALPVLID